MNIKEAKQILRESGQEHVLGFWDKLSAGEQAHLLAQIDGLDFRSIERMQGMLNSGDAVEVKSGAEPVPSKVLKLAGEELSCASAAGEEHLRAGKVGVLLVAGGQGSRLGYDGPKGAYSIGPVSGASLFYFHARKILGLSNKYGVRIPLYIMTSELNDAVTREHFKESDFFGLNPDDVIFFTQGMWPALDREGRIMMDQPGHIFMSPDGHGGTLTALNKQGCLVDMEKRGIETIFFFQVDNPMVEIADPAFIGAHINRQADISVKLCAKREPLEGLGVVVERDGCFEMVEYTELTDEQAHQRADDGELYFKYGSVAIHLFSHDFMRAESICDMPLHIAHKKIPVCNVDGTVIMPEEPNGCKFEKFIFDVLPDAKRVVNLAFDRAEEFSPVKNAEGRDSPDSCKRDLQLKWLRWFKQLGIDIPVDEIGLPLIPLEIDPAYALNADELREKGIMIKGDMI